MTTVLVMEKMAALFTGRFFLFLGRRIQSEYKQLFHQIFPSINFLIKPSFDTFNTQEVLKK